MSNSHDELATKAGNVILQKIRKQENGWKQVFSSAIHRTGGWDWPRPDYVCADKTLKATYALEFKPPGQPKREYLTGLGQSLAYLQGYNYAGLIVPSKSVDNYPIADFINTTLSSGEFAEIPISLFTYDITSIVNTPESSVSILKEIKKNRSSAIVHKTAERKTFWCWWRDMSNYELFQLMELSDSYRSITGDIYSKKIFDKFWGLLTSGKTKMWDGKPRNKADTSRKNEKQNYKIPLFQLDLWSQAEGRLTFKGYKLLSIGKIYGPNSPEFIDYLTYLVLVDGKHLELINEFQEFQNINTGKIANKSEKFALELENHLDKKGLIGKRKPGRKTTGAKGSYLRDETKLWNKLSLLKREKSKLFFPGEGYKFDWERITKIISKDFNFL
jgi:hypothetical protein